MPMICCKTVHVSIICNLKHQNTDIDSQIVHGVLFAENKNGIQTRILTYRYWSLASWFKAMT